MKNAMSTLAATLILSWMTTLPQTAYGQMERAELADGGYLLYETAGDPNGEPVLLIHGGFVAASFLPMMTESALSDYFLIRYHRRGYGGSSDTEVGGREREAQDAFELLAYLGVAQAHVVGHSAGGPIALQMAATQPAIVHSVILLEGSRITNFERLMDAQGLNLEELRQGFEDFWARDRERSTNPQAVDGFFQQYYGDDWRTEAPKLLPGVIEQARDDVRNNWLSSRVNREPFENDFFDAIKQPILYLVSRDGNTFTKMAVSFHSEMMPHMVTKTIQDIPNHLFQMRYPQQTARELAAWLSAQPF